ncbi:MAG: ribonuclease HII [Candidatus Levybacteria bacterium]|nr:ribonuclease HII [Candidatus Levybacteria bacterium]
MYNKAVILPNFSEESKLWKKRFKYVIGVDEVGRGAFAGPVSAAAVVFECQTEELSELGINDSKLLKPRQRKKLSKLIQDGSMAYSIATVGVPAINKTGIGKATQTAFRKAIGDVLAQLSKNTEYSILDTKYYVLADGFHIKYVKKIGLKNQKAIVKGDRISISIAAASIIAKVHRDLLMKKASRKYPKYGLGRNKGYGTKEHREAIKKYGLLKIHRTSFNLSRFEK